MSELQTRHFDPLPATSGLPPETDIVNACAVVTLGEDGLTATVGGATDTVTEPEPVALV